MTRCQSCGHAIGVRAVANAAASVAWSFAFDPLASIVEVANG